MEKTINQYKGEAFKIFTEQNNWKYQALTNMLNMPSSVLAREPSLMSHWWNISIELHSLSFRLFNALESELSFRAYRRAAQLLDMWEAKVNQVIKYMESLKGVK